jgi:GTP-binding protein
MAAIPHSANTKTVTPETSHAAGKTRLINHFFINGAWFLVDLPGYG